MSNEMSVRASRLLVPVSQAVAVSDPKIPGVYGISITAQSDQFQTVCRVLTAGIALVSQLANETMLAAI